MQSFLCSVAEFFYCFGVVGYLVDIFIHADVIAQPSACLQQMVRDFASHDYQAAEQIQFETALVSSHYELAFFGRAESEGGDMFLQVLF